METNKDNNSLDLDQKLIETTSKVEAFYHNNKKNINMSLIVIVVLIGGYLAVKNFYLEPRESEAQVALFPAQQFFESDSFDLALNGKGEKLGFLAVADEYGMTKAGNLAHFYAGICYMRKADFANAIEQLESYSGSNELIKPMAEGLLGDAYVESGDIEKGIKHYLKASAVSNNKMAAPVYLKKAGVAYEELKEYSSALDMYEKIRSEYPDAQESQDIEKYIARAKAAKENS